MKELILKRRAVVVWITLLTLAASCGVPQPTSTSSRQNDNQVTATPLPATATSSQGGSTNCYARCELRVGKTGYVKLEVVSNLPYRWQVTEIDTAALELVGEPDLTYESGPGPGTLVPPGSDEYPATQVFRFRAKRAGETTLTLTLRHVSGTPESGPEETHSVRVSVQ